MNFYLYSAFYNTGLSQSSFTKGPGIRPPQSKPRATVARTPWLTGRNLEQNQAQRESPSAFGRVAELIWLNNNHNHYVDDELDRFDYYHELFLLLWQLHSVQAEGILSLILAPVCFVTSSWPSALCAVHTSRSTGCFCSIGSWLLLDILNVTLAEVIFLYQGPVPQSRITEFAI